MIALIDGDLVVYQNAFRAQDSVDFGDGQLLATANTSVAIAEAEDQLRRIAEEVGGTRTVIALSDPDDNFRKDVWPDYKRPRGIVKRPLAYTALREHLQENHEVVLRPRLEADDVLGIIATGNVRGFRGDKVVCSTDKDLRTVPCFLYNWERPGGGIWHVTEGESDWNFYIQVLTGDPTDSFPGCPGIGKVRAERLLRDAAIWEPSALWEAVVAAYEKAGKTEDDAIVQARCARILRAEDYDFKKKEVRLWTPPK